MVAHKSQEEASLSGALKKLGARMDPLIGLMDHLPGTRFWIKDLEGRFCWVNTAVVLSRGLSSRTEMIGKSDSDFYEARNANLFRQDDRYVEAGNSIRGRVEELVINHVSCWYSTSKVPLRDRRGRVVATAGLATPVPRPSRGVGDESPLALAIQHMGRHFNEPIKNSVLAKVCGMSLGNFQRQFRDSYRCSPHTYVRELRVRLSCQALVNTAHSLAMIAEAHGFSDQSHFTKEFRRMMKETPRAYRQRFRK